MQTIHLFHIEDEQQIFHCHHTRPQNTCMV